MPRAALRFFLFTILSAVIVGLQTIILPFYRGKWSYVLPQYFQSGTRRIFGIRAIVEGQPLRDRQVIYIGNHLSYFDIPVVGSFVRGSFVARGDLSGWPVFGYMSKMQQTIFISRKREDAERGKEQLDAALKAGKNLIIFAEGTSSDGSAVLPFKSSLFGLPIEHGVTVQPFTISLLEADGKPASTTEVRDLYAWHRDMTLPPHISAFAKSKGAKVKVTFHPPRAASDYADRKALCRDCENDVAGGLIRV